METPAPLGGRRWLVPDCFIPSDPADPTGDADSHEAICVLNTATDDATVIVTAYFEDRDPMRFVAEVVPAERTRHLRTDTLRTADGDRLPLATSYAVLVVADLDVTVQYSRLDESTGTRTLMTTVALPAAER